MARIGELLLPNEQGQIHLDFKDVMPQHAYHIVLEEGTNADFTVYRLGSRGHDLIGYRYSALTAHPRRLVDFSLTAEDYQALYAMPFITQELPAELQVVGHPIKLNRTSRSVNVHIPKPLPIKDAIPSNVDLHLQKRAFLVAPWNEHPKDRALIYSGSVKQRRLAAVLRVT